MARRGTQRYLLIAAVIALLVIPFLPSRTFHAALLAQNEEEQPQEEVLGEAADETAAPVSEPECTFFTNFQQYSAIGPAGFERAVSQDTSLHLEALSSETEEVSRSLAAIGGAREPNFAGPWVSRIDYHIFSTLQAKNIAPAPLTTDAEFLRRVTVDLIGRIPTGDQVQQFSADTDPQKRAKAIDRLLNSPEWVDRWTMWLGDLLHNNSASTQINRGTPGRDALYSYIRTSVQYNKPYNQLVSELLTGVGDTYVSGPAEFVLGGTMSMGPAQDTYDRQWVQAATMFLGLKNFDCLLCHDGSGHLDGVNLWASQVKRSDAWRMAAFFSRYRSVRPNGASWTITEAAPANPNTLLGYPLNTNSGNRPNRAPITGQATSPVMPRYIFSGRNVGNTENFRGVLAQELTKDLQFARATVNYIWAHFFTVGIVDPPDAFDLARLDPRNPPPAPWTIQPSNPELLDELAREFVNNGFNLKDLMREITNSQAYQLSSRYNGTWSSSYARYYARHLIRRLESEELADSVVQSSGVANNMSIVLGSGQTVTIPWAMQLPETIVPARGNAVGAFLDTFLRGDRDENSRRTDLSSSQALSLMNDNFVISRVRGTTATGGRMAILMGSTNDNTQLIRMIYVNVLSRYPTSQELAAELQRFSAGVRANNVQDLVWALYNKVDFVFNY